MSGRVANKIALITGGASGIGKAISEVLAKEGATVIVTDVNEKNGEAVVKNIGKDSIFLKLDTSSEDNWKSVFETVEKKFGKLNVVVNNAGIALPGLDNVESTSFAAWRKLQSINLDGVFLGTKYGIELMKKHNVKGSVINLSSIEGLIGDPELLSYNASKGGVKLMSMSAALDVAKLGIRVNTVHPGYIGTELTKKLCLESEPGKTDFTQTERYKKLAVKHAVGHWGEPEDIAYGVLYLASDESKFVTGSQLVIDGGYTAQ